MEKLAAFDIGSNAIRVLTANWDQKETLVMGKRIRIPLRLGSQTFSQGFFSDYFIDKSATIFEGLKNLMEREHVSRYRAVATSAYRESSNADKMGEEILRRSGIAIEAVSGDTEGKIIFNAVGRKIDLTKKSFLLSDIGGGSLELSAVIKGELVGTESFNLGTVRLLEGDVSMEDIFKREKVSHFLKKYFSKNESVKIIGTGGNYFRMLKLKAKLFDKKAEHILPRELSEIYDCLSDYSPLQRMKKFGLKKDRADVILPALTIVKMIVGELNVKKIYCPNIGLGHGVLFELAGKKLKKIK